MAIRPGRGHGADQGVDEGTQLGPPSLAAAFAHDGRQEGRGDESR